MDRKLKNLQKKVLASVAKIDELSFSLAGGIALEIFYLHHRFSRDLDFFANRYDPDEIEKIVAGLRRDLGCQILKKMEFATPQNARVVFYHLEADGLELPLRIDFVEEVLLADPGIKIFNGLRVYDVEEIYSHKVFTISGSREDTDAVGRVLFSGRNQPRDAVDIYYLSKKVKPLHKFLSEVPRGQQHSFVRWAKTYSRMDMKLGVLDLEIYDQKFSAREMIKHIDNEIDKFVGGII